MRFAYADPPYLGCGALYAKHHPDALAWDDPETHRGLIDRLVADFPDGWAMSLSSPSLWTILPMCPHDVRVMAWVKPFAVCFWLFDVLGMEPGDDFVDLFPGSGAVGRAWEEWRRQPRLKLTEKRPKSARNKGNRDVLPIEM